MCIRPNDTTHTPHHNNIVYDDKTKQLQELEPAIRLLGNYIERCVVPSSPHSFAPPQTTTTTNNTHGTHTKWTSIHPISTNLPPKLLQLSFDSVEETFEPVADGSKDHCFISSSYDATR